MKITKQWLITTLLLLVSWQSEASAILKTNSALYESTITTQFHDGEIDTMTSQGGLFYAMGDDDKFIYSNVFEKKYNVGSYTESYSHYAYTEVRHSFGSLIFNVGQDGGNFNNDFGGRSFAYETFNFDWNFKVIAENAWLDLVLLSGSGKSIFSLTNLSMNEIMFSDSIAHSQTEKNSLLLQKGSDYLISLSMSNSSFTDGMENYTHLRLDNASFPVPTPNNILILLLAITALLLLRKPLK